MCKYTPIYLYNSESRNLPQSQTTLTWTDKVGFYKSTTFKRIPHKLGAYLLLLHLLWIHPTFRPQFLHLKPAKLEYIHPMRWLSRSNFNPITQADVHRRRKDAINWIAFWLWMQQKCTFIAFPFVESLSPLWRLSAGSRRDGSKAMTASKTLVTPIAFRCAWGNHLTFFYLSNRYELFVECVAFVWFLHLSPLPSSWLKRK